MQRRAECWNVSRPEVTYTRYKENVQWNRPQRQHLPGSIQQNFDYQYWCETCDKGFTTAQFLENHKLQHQKCNIDGCQFIAHPKIITKHIQMQHSTGLFKRIGKLNNPEDIKKWREERKRKYPTLENITKKEAQIKEKINRGEKMGMKNERNRRHDKTDFQNRSNQRFSQTHRARHSQERYNQNNTNNRKRVAADVTKSHLTKKIFKIIPSMEETRTLRAFPGIIQIEDDLDEKTETEFQCSVPIEDDEDIHNASETVQNDIIVSEPAVCSALTSLMCCYASSDEDNVESNSQCKDIKKPLNKNKASAEEVKNNDRVTSQVQAENSKIIEFTKNIKVQFQVSEKSVPNCQDADDDSGPEEIKICKEGTSVSVDNIENPKTKLSKKLSSKKIINRNYSSTKNSEFRKRLKLPSTLLEKLLHREIQHERNVILQCVRYVVKNKYFENS